MGTGEEKSGLMSSKWMTIILVGVLVILAVILIWVLKDPRGFERFKKKKQPKDLKPPTIGQQLHNPSDQPILELADSRLMVIAELSWQKSIPPPQA